MGFEGGEWLSRILVPIACRLSKPRNSFGKFASEEGESSYRQFFWRGVLGGKAALADFLAENLPRGEGSYRQFWERRALGEGSYRRFVGGEFAEPAACEGRLARGARKRKV